MLVCCVRSCACACHVVQELEVSGRGSVACAVGETCVIIVSPSAAAAAAAAAFEGITFEARLIGPSIINVHMQPVNPGSYRMYIALS